MHFAIIDMEVQTAGRFQKAVSLLHTGLQEGQVVIKNIVVRLLPDADGFITSAAKTCPVAVFVLFSFDLSAGLYFLGIEWRIDIDQVDRFGGHFTHELQVIRVDDLPDHVEIVAQAEFLR